MAETWENIQVWAKQAVGNGVRRALCQGGAGHQRQGDAVRAYSDGLGQTHAVLSLFPACELALVSIPPPPRVGRLDEVPGLWEVSGELLLVKDPNGQVPPLTSPNPFSPGLGRD